jgi:hypothetical protein
MSGNGARSRRNVGLVGVVGGLFALLAFFGLLGYYGDVTGFLWASNEDARMVSHLESRVGRPVVLIDGTGHDGQYFFLQANDPWLTNPGEGLEFLDFPTYRAQRMLYPVVAGIGGVLAPSQILWGLVITNIFAMGAGSWGLGRLVSSLGMSQWLGLAFALNPGIIFELAINGGSLLGWALAVWGLVAVQEQRWGIGSALFAGAVLARETMVLVAIGACAFVWFRDRRLRPALVITPLVAAGIWWLWVRQQLESLPKPAGAQTLDVPFRGLWVGMSNWISTGGLNLALGVLVVFCAVVIVASAMTRPSLLAWATVGFVPLLLILHPAVTVGGLNITRAMVPVVSAALVLVLGRRAFAGPAAAPPV